MEARFWDSGRYKFLLLVVIMLYSSAHSFADFCPELDGDFRQGGLVWGFVAPDTRLFFDGVRVPVLADGTFVLGFGRNANSDVSLTVGDDLRCPIRVKSREYRISRVEGVPQRTVTPPPEQLDRIRRDRELVKAAKATRLTRPDLLLAVREGLSWPAEGRISGIYGSQRFYNGVPGSPHYGVDIAVPTGHPVSAPGPGLITLAEPDLFYSGGTIILDHGYGVSSSFLHLSRIDVVVGQEVKRGDMLGGVGSTGRATGPHLDWRMNWLDSRIDPQRLVPPMPSRD